MDRRTVAPDAPRSDAAAAAGAVPTASPSSRPSSAALGKADHPPRALCLSSTQLFGGALEVQIDHHGAVYRLKQTALGKLILTK